MNNEANTSTNKRYLIHFKKELNKAPHLINAEDQTEARNKIINIFDMSEVLMFEEAKASFLFFSCSEGIAILEEEGTKEVIETRNAGDINYDCFVFIEGYTKPHALIEAKGIHNEYSYITEDEFYRLVV